jgi:hypothetical protein
MVTLTRRGALGALTGGAAAAVGCGAVSKLARDEGAVLDRLSVAGQAFAGAKPPTPAPTRSGGRPAAVDAGHAACLANLPTAPEPLDPAAALALAAELLDTEGPRDRRTLVGAYALALWESTQDHRTRDLELAMAAIAGHSTWREVEDLGDAGYGAVVAAVQFGARVGLQLAQGLAPPRPGDAAQAAWLARAHRAAERA